MADTAQVQALILEGRLDGEKWSILGIEVIFDLFDAGGEEEAYALVNGLDRDAKERRLSVELIARALRSVGGYDFKGELEEKRKFLRSLQPHVKDLFSAKFIELRLLQANKFVERVKELGKS